VINLEYLFNEFVKDVKMGREIEFTYNKNMYFVTHNKRGWLLIKTDDRTSQCFDCSESLIKNAKIGSEYLIELWDEIKLDTVY